MVTNAELSLKVDTQSKEINQLSTHMSELEDKMNTKFEALGIQLEAITTVVSKKDESIKSPNQ